MLTRKEVLEEYHNDILRKIVKQELDARQHKEQANLKPEMPDGKVKAAFEKAQTDLENIKTLQKIKPNGNIPISKIQKANERYMQSARDYSMQEMRRQLRITEQMLKEEK